MIRDRKYLDSLREEPCIITGLTPCEPAHIRWGMGGGMGLKPDDSRTVPLVPQLHRRQHQIGEKRFWAEQPIDFWLRILIEVAEGRYVRTNKS